MESTILHGNCCELLKTIPDNSIDSVITDPPYELGFMAKDWDSSGIAYNTVMWKHVLRVLKPGGYMLSFGGTRTYHRMTCAIEDAGFEIRDCLMWLYGSGFPKSMNISKAIDGYMLHGKTDSKALKVVNDEDRSGDGRIRITTTNNGIMGDSSGSRIIRDDAITEEAKKWIGWGTALKPAYEPILLARKPFDSTIAKNILTYGTSGLNIDTSRVKCDGGSPSIQRRDSALHSGNVPIDGKTANLSNEEGRINRRGSNDAYISQHYGEEIGRWPANIILDEESASILDKQSGILKSGTGAVKKTSGAGYSPNAFGKENRPIGTPNIEYGDSGGASRFFYCAKASQKEKNNGLNGKNIHPTVKPLELIRYLCKLVTPTGGTILDPFCGSGTTGMAAKIDNFDFIGMELNKEYIAIAEARIKEIKQ